MVFPVRLLSIAALQISPLIDDVEGTVAEFERRVTTLADTFNELQLVVAPELHLPARLAQYYYSDRQY